MRRALLAVGLVGGAGAACTTFNFARPSAGDDAGADATAEAAADGGSDGGATTFLPPADAARLCAQLFKCGHLAEAIELSLALPLDTPASPLSYSSCMDWVAGPVDPARPGLKLQQGILLGVANAATCTAAEAQLPVQWVKLDGGCTAGCADSTTLAMCATGQTFTSSCSSAWFGQTGACFEVDDAGVTPGGDAAASSGATAYCVSLGACKSGASCVDTYTLRDCYPPGYDAFTWWNCAISGRECDSASGHVAACVVPGKLAPPCVLKEVKDTCDGNAVVHCAGGYMPQTEFDCSAVSATGSCSTLNQPGVARCVRQGDQCNPFDSAQNQCSGPAISICVAGQPQSFDCSSIGMACQPGDATHTAHCG